MNEKIYIDEKKENYGIIIYEMFVHEVKNSFIVSFKKTYLL